MHGKGGPCGNQERGSLPPGNTRNQKSDVTGTLEEFPQHVFLICSRWQRQGKNGLAEKFLQALDFFMERETGFEPATFSLGS